MVEASEGLCPTDHALLANGVSGAWRIDVDETTSGPGRWFVQIEGPLVHFNFEIPSLEVIHQIGRFLAHRPPTDHRPAGPGPGLDWEVVIWGNPHTPVRVLRDDEFDDRFFLVVGPANAPVVRYTLADDDVKCVAAALEQVLEDLPD